MWRKVVMWRKVTGKSARPKSGLTLSFSPSSKVVMNRKVTGKITISGRAFLYCRRTIRVRLLGFVIG
jgi:hypothetical protein